MKIESLLIFIILSFSSLMAHGDFKASKVKKIPKSMYHLKSNLNLVRKDDLMDTLRSFISATLPDRMVGSSGHERAVKWLIKTIREYDPDLKNIVYVDEFKPDTAYAIEAIQNDFDTLIKPNYKETNENYQKWRGFTASMIDAIRSRKNNPGKNIIWEKKGSLSPEKILVIGAHYDTIYHDKKTKKVLDNKKMPGADDNGSGVAIALNLIRVFSHMSLPVTVRVVFFDWEEFRGLGSKAFVKKYKLEFLDKTYLGFINLLMLGHDSKVFDEKKRYGNMSVYIRRPGVAGSALDRSMAERMVAAGKKASPSVRFDIIANSLESADTVAFWNEDLFGVTFSQNWQDDFNNKNNHTENDFVETINQNTYYRAYKYIGGAIGDFIFGPY